MIKSTKIYRVTVYHDETKDVPGEKRKGHVLLFVPETVEVSQQTPLFGTFRDTQNPRGIFMNLMDSIRQKWACEDRKFHFTDISGRRWSKYDQALLELNQLAVEAMRTKGPCPTLKQPLAFKLAVIFYPQNADFTLYGGATKAEKRVRYDETILRILLKGAVHFLYSGGDKIEVLRLVCDGQPEHRRFSEDRILWQLLVEEESGRKPLQSYVSLHPEAYIKHVPSDHKKHVRSSEGYVDANLLQVADVLLGSVRHIFFGNHEHISTRPQLWEECRNKRSIIAKPVWEMLKKVERGYAFIQSGHYRTFAVSCMDFEGDSIAFSQLNLPNLSGEDEGMVSLF